MLQKITLANLSEIFQKTDFGLHNIPLNHMPHWLSVEHFFVISIPVCQISMITMVVPFLLLPPAPFSPPLPIPPSAPPPLPSPTPPPPTPPPPAAFSSLPACCWGCCRLTWLSGCRNHQLCVRNPSYQHSTLTHAHMHGYWYTHSHICRDVCVQVRIQVVGLSYMANWSVLILSSSYLYLSGWSQIASWNL